VRYKSTVNARWGQYDELFCELWRTLPLGKSSRTLTNLMNMNEQNNYDLQIDTRNSIGSFAHSLLSAYFFCTSWSRDGSAPTIRRSLGEIMERQQLFIIIIIKIIVDVKNISSNCWVLILISGFFHFVPWVDVTSSLRLCLHHSTATCSTYPSSYTCA